LVNQTEAHFQAKFSRKDARSVDEGAQGKLTVFGVSRKSEILSIDEEYVTLQIDGTPIADLSKVTLSVDSSWLIEQMLQTLVEQQEGRKRYCAKSALLAVGEGEGIEARGGIAMHSENLNFNQEEAIELATSWHPGFIWGPPGTGKTHALGYLVGELVKRDERVLLTSNTNVAVDTALLTTFRALKNHPRIKDGLLVRVGPMQRADVYSEIAEYVDVSKIVQRKSAHLLQKKNQAQLEQKRIEVRAQVLGESIDAYSAHRPLIKKLSSLQSSKAQNTKRIAEVDEKLLGLRSRLVTFDGKIEVANSKGTFARILDAESSAKSLTRQRNSVVAEIAEAEDVRRKLVLRGGSLDIDLLQLQGRLPGDLTSDAARLNFDDLEKELVQLRKQWRELQATVVSCDEEMANISSQILRNASAVFTTAYRTQSTSFDATGEFHASIIDEASMLPLPLAWIVAGKANDRFIAAGDFRQLPPIAQSRDPQVDAWYRRSVFDCSSIPARVESRGEIRNLGMLNMQYRMPQAISDLVSNFAYPEYGLVCMSDEPGGSNFNKSPILLFDSSSAGAFVEKIDSSRANSKHVQAVEAIVANLLSSGDVTYESLVSQIAIVTPYRPQTKRLVAALEKTIGDEVAKRIVTTVHRMQGNEKNYVILDLVDAPPEDIGFILSGNLLRDPGPRLLNVAVSRPRKQLLVIANFEHISGRAPTGHSYRGTQMARFTALLAKSGHKVDLAHYLESGRLTRD
jgi:hypothetical protein